VVNPFPKSAVERFHEFIQGSGGFELASYSMGPFSRPGSLEFQPYIARSN